MFALFRLEFFSINEDLMEEVYSAAQLQVPIPSIIFNF